MSSIVDDHISLSTIETAGTLVHRVISGEISAALALPRIRCIIEQIRAAYGKIA